MNELLRRILNLPQQASTVAGEIDALHYFVIGTTMAGALLVSLIAAYYLLRYRREVRRGGHVAPDRRRGHTRGGMPFWLEGVIIACLLTLFVTWWVIGFRQYVRLRVAPADTLDIYVTGKKWMWSFAYPDGSGSNSILYVPVNRPVKLIMSSRDVIHSFYVPAFRIKQDVVPGRTTTTWFEVTEPGTYVIFCAEYCGTGHSTMRGQVVALSERDYERRLERQPPVEIAGPEATEPGLVGRRSRQGLTLAEVGERVAVKHGCLRCHTADGSDHIGPTWVGMYLSEVPLSEGSRIVADAAYLTESMMDPMAKIRRGYPAVMPAYQGLITAAETGALVEYIKSLRVPAPDVPTAPLAPSSEPVELPTADDEAQRPEGARPIRVEEDQGPVDDEPTQSPPATEDEER